jgi:hypothetical protein
MIMKFVPKKKSVCFFFKYNKSSFVFNVLKDTLEIFNLSEALKLSTNENDGSTIVLCLTSLDLYG